MQTKRLLLIGLLAVSMVTMAQTPQARRAVLLKEASLEVLVAGTKDTNAVVRHTAIRQLTEHPQGVAELKKLLMSSDSGDRRLALQGLCLREAADVELLGKMSGDEDDNVRQLAVSQLASVKPAEGRRLEILTEVARKEKVRAIRDIASKATWPFQRNVVLLRNRADWDHDVLTLQDILLPQDNWLFELDADGTGHLKSWYKPSFDASGWKTVPIAATWESAGYDYDGLAWYRKTFKAPAKPEKFNAVELMFEAVDECAWVWLNGVYVGEHNLGSAGWQMSFSLDITKEIKWGEDNTIIVRVLDTAGAGGIYKPVHLQVME